MPHPKHGFDKVAALEVTAYTRRRTVHEDAQCVGWNWGAPFKLGVNCIYVNGRTCICFASSVLSTEDLAAIRDHAQGRLLEFTSED